MTRERTYFRSGGQGRPLRVGVYLNWALRKEQVKRNSIPGERNSLCKGPTVRKSTACWRNEEVSVSGVCLVGSGETPGDEVGRAGGTRPQRALWTSVWWKALQDFKLITGTTGCMFLRRSIPVLQEKHILGVKDELLILTGSVKFLHVLYTKLSR